jgi:hypothetical protein
MQGCSASAAKAPASSRGPPAPACPCSSCGGVPPQMRGSAANPTLNPNLNFGRAARRWRTWSSSRCWRTGTASRSSLCRTPRTAWTSPRTSAQLRPRCASWACTDRRRRGRLSRGMPLGGACIALQARTSARAGPVCASWGFPGPAGARSCVAHPAVPVAELSARRADCLGCMGEVRRANPMKGSAESANMRKLETGWAPDGNERAKQNACKDR